MTARTDTSSRAALRAADHAVSGPGRIARRAAAAIVRVAVAHRDPVVRAALREALGDDAGLAVVGEAATGEEVAALAAHLSPDVVMVDVRIPGTGCVAATQDARGACGAAVVLLAGDDPDPRVLAALRAGAAGVMSTESTPSDLIRALTLLGRGRPLRPRHARRRNHIREEPMQTPKVVELRRGSAHTAPIALSPAATASRVRHDGGRRWNSGT
jgi:DNA-binding NarL/FixJ family response regulator